LFFFSANWADLIGWAARCRLGRWAVHPCGSSQAVRCRSAGPLGRAPLARKKGLRAKIKEEEKFHNFFFRKQSLYEFDEYLNEFE
jgi:hypothetical protein